MIVVDTHVLVWWASGDQHRLTPTARAALEAEGERILVSAISAWEIAMLVAQQRLVLATPVTQWIAQVAKVPGLEFVAIDPAISLESVFLPGNFHRDPADRLIVATARSRGCALLSADEKIQQYPHVRVIW